MTKCTGVNQGGRVKGTGLICSPMPRSTSRCPFALLQGKGRKRKSKESKIMGIEIGKTPKTLSLAPRRGRTNREGPRHPLALPSSRPVRHRWQDSIAAMYMKALLNRALLHHVHVSRDRHILQPDPRTDRGHKHPPRTVQERC